MNKTSIVSKGNSTILKVLVGSQAHGLATPNSDKDYRAVFLTPTEDFHKLYAKPKSTTWVEGDEDNTGWELGHFLEMACKCNPTILEVFHAPVMETTTLGVELRGMFNEVWNIKDLVNSHVGYSLNQRKKFFDKEHKHERKSKYAVAYLRTLYVAYHFLETGDYIVDMAGTPVHEVLTRWKTGDWKVGEVVEMCELFKDKIEAFPIMFKKETNIDKVNEFIIRVRKENYSA